MFWLPVQCCSAVMLAPLALCTVLASSIALGLTNAYQLPLPQALAVTLWADSSTTIASLSDGPALRKTG